jgi:hypothetical protein
MEPHEQEYGIPAILPNSIKRVNNKLDFVKLLALRIWSRSLTSYGVSGRKTGELSGPTHSQLFRTVRFGGACVPLGI